MEPLEADLEQPSVVHSIHHEPSAQQRRKGYSKGGGPSTLVHEGFVMRTNTKLWPYQGFFAHYCDGARPKPGSKKQLAMTGSQLRRQRGAFLLGWRWPQETQPEAFVRGRRRRCGGCRLRHPWGVPTQLRDRPIRSRRPLTDVKGILQIASPGHRGVAQGKRGEDKPERRGPRWFQPSLQPEPLLLMP